MTSNKDFKKVVRAFARRSGLPYAAALRQVLSEDPPPRREREARVEGWSITGSHAGEYELKATNERVDGKRVAELRCKVEHPGGFGAQVQTFSAEEYLGKRVRFSGLLRTESVEGWAGLWMRVDAKEVAHLAFDNMQDRSLTGTTEWTRCEIVLDVAPEAARVLVGTILHGSGTVYMADFSVEAVGQDVPTTGVPTRKQPVNLDFEGG